MNRILGFAAIIIALSVATHSVDAAETWVASTVTHLMPLASGVIQVSVAAHSPSCTNASNPKRYMLTTSASMTAEGKKNIYATLLYAAAADKTVWLFFDNASSNCVITRVSVQN